MHTATQLYPESFTCDVDGVRTDFDQIFPGWGCHDRFGIVVDRPWGVLGASLLVQSAIASFYDVRPARRHQNPCYPEIYAFHIGEPMGDHSSFDFWPPHKEVVVSSATPIALLTAVNSRGVSRLAVPARADGRMERLEDGPSTWSEQQSARDRIASCYAYDPAGEVPSADMRIWSTDPRVEENTTNTFTLVERVQSVLDSTDPTSYDGRDAYRWAVRVRERAHEVPRLTQSAIRHARARATPGPGIVRSESFRRLTVDEALAIIAGLGDDGARFAT